MTRSIFKSARLRSELTGLVLVLAAMAFSAWYAAPELRIERVPINDIVYHLTASERMETAFDRGEPFLDPWVSEWALGYPVWRSYQPLPHVFAAFAFKAFRGVGDSTAVFAWLVYLLIVFFPLSVYVGARLLGLPPPAAGLGAVLAFSTAAPAGDLERFGLGYGSIVWRGTGLYTQLFALHLLVPALGVSRRALDEGSRGSRVAASTLLALTSISHIVFGYAAFVSIGILALVGPRGQRASRLVRLVTIAVPAMLMLAWFVVPLALAGQVTNHSRWEAPFKWDSFGAAPILSTLIRGQLFDFGRFPVVTIVLAAGTLSCALFRNDPALRRLLALAGLWLVLFFGRATWGNLVLLAGVPADLPMHRLQGVFELFAVMVGAAGVARVTGWLWPRDKWLAALAMLGLVACVVVAGRERAAYLRLNGLWGDATAAAYGVDRTDLDAALREIRTVLEERPGRVSAGMANSWGQQFRIGSAQVFAFLSREHFDQTSFLYHAMSKTSDVMMVRNENDPAQDVVFGVRAVIAPASISMPPHLRLRSVHRRFAVYESSAEGYFGVTDVVAHFQGDSSAIYDTEVAWLKSDLPAQHLVVSLDTRLPVGPAVTPGQVMPAPTSEHPATPGVVINESKVGERYAATVAVSRPAYALVKVTWNPDLHARVDGTSAPLYLVTPGFGAIPLTAGQHEVTVAYEPGPTRAVLFVAALGVPVLTWFLLGLPRMRDIETRAVDRSRLRSQRSWVT